jgi:hypothetical protein
LDAKQELEQLRKLKRLHELEQKSKSFITLKEGQELNALNAEKAEQLGPTSGMSEFQKGAAGAGKAVADAGRGAKQAFYEQASDPLGLGLTPNSFQNELSQINSEIAENRKFDQPLMKTGAGQIGNVVGNAAITLPALPVPGLNTYKGAATMGGLLGMVQPTTEDESRLLNTAVGAGAGVAGKGVADVLSAILRSGYGGIKGLVAPFTESGRKGIAANTLRAFASNPDDVAARLAQADEIIPGSMPTAADVSQDAGVSQLQRSVQAADPQIADDFAQRALDRNSARLNAMKGLTKYGDDLEGAISRRSEVGGKLYEKALKEAIEPDESFQAIKNRPSFKQALDRASRIAAEEGVELGDFDGNGKVSVKTLHYIKMGMDDLINDAPQSGIGKTELGAIKQTRGKLLDWMSEKSPSYKSARVRFEKMSRPINRQQVSDEILSRATRSQTPNVRGDMTIYPSSYGGALKNEGESVVRKATGQVGKTLEDVMTPDQLQILENILKDASGEQAGINFGRAVGSNTAQNLAGMNVLRQVTGPFGLPQAWAERNVFPTVARGMNLVYGGQEPFIKQKLAEALLNPKLAAELLNSVPPAQQHLLASELLRALPASTGAAVAAQH